MGTPVRTVDPIGPFMRLYGVKFLYILFVIIFVLFTNTVLLVDDSDYPTPPTYPLHMIIILWIVRVLGIILFLPSLILAATFLFAKFPTLDTTIKPPIFDQKDDKLEANGSQITHRQVKSRVEFLIIRIITRGDYPNLIKRNVAYHVDLIDRYCHCDRLEVHVVTETALHGDYTLGRNARVREMLVPSTFTIPVGTVGKARNMAYWIENWSDHPPYPPKNRIWILGLDEDSFVTESFVINFLQSFLPSGAHCSASPYLFDLPSSAGFLNAVAESSCMAVLGSSMWFESNILKATPLWFRTTGYAIRCDVEEQIGFQYPPELCVTEDYTFGHYFSDNGYKICYINGWNWEGGALDFLSLIKQRAAWFRGHIYVFLYQRMSCGRRFRCAVQLAVMFLLLGPIMMCSVLMALLWCIGYCSVPIGSHLWVDYFTCWGFATNSFAVVYGAWYILPSRKATVVTFALFCGIGVLLSMGVHLAEMVVTVYTLIDQLHRGRPSRSVTRKIRYN